MGEPLLNWSAVDVALSILNAPDGFGIGARHITVSTVGILPGMAELAKRPEQFRLAISLHATTTAQRLGAFVRYEWASGEFTVSGGLANDSLLADIGNPRTLDASVPYATVSWLTRF